jgi:hypothetical protein
MLEENLQKSENDVRKHIRLEQQLKLHIDGLEDHIEELEGRLKQLQGTERNPIYKFKRSADVREKRSKLSLDKKRSVNSRTGDEDYLQVRQQIVQKRKGS